MILLKKERLKWESLKFTTVLKTVFKIYNLQ